MPADGPYAHASGTPGDRVLVAGIGNLFLGDDGFGPEVVRRLADRADLPPRVRLVDYGIRGMHLAYDLLDGYDALVLVDACPGEGPPGSVAVLEVGADDLGEGEFDAHGMNPVAVLANLGQLGGTLPLTFVVGCVPADLDEGIGLSGPVAAAVPEAMDAVYALVRRLGAEDPAAATVPPATTPPATTAVPAAATEPRRT
ncbi:hydrogenase maturation protease [Streptomyces sp. 8L]|uniref:hydrogenase maturation protease n=1 Tax=Streptomyces sp. 8L TaxID=2877242 RepID=UPI001CD25E0C|nr:hydrogenase maturation protease [Streptomyces sp. 8L]MCA1220391.1 hydrogenase maturation protease [Streptomyces sp. 8L]